ASQPGGGPLGPLDDLQRDRAEPEPVDHVDLGRDRGGLGAGADYQQVGLAQHGSTITSPRRSGLKEIALLRIRSARVSTGWRATAGGPGRSPRLYPRSGGGGRGAATGAAAEGNPGVGAWLPVDETLGDEAARVLVGPLVEGDRVDAGRPRRPRRQ